MFISSLKEAANMSMRYAYKRGFCSVLTISRSAGGESRLPHLLESIMHSNRSEALAQDWKTVGVSLDTAIKEADKDARRLAEPKR
jgi:hypothetical protein